MVLYCVAASILGIIFIVGPLFALALFANKSSAVLDPLYSEGLQRLEKETYGYYDAHSSLDVGIFALCFFIALAVYLLFKRRSRVYHPESIWFRPLY